MFTITILRLSTWTRRVLGMGVVMLALLLVGLLSADAVEPNIIVTTPAPNAIVTNPLVIQGQARVFENTLNYRLTDADGRILVQGFTTAQSPDVGEFGPFSVRAPFVPPRNTTGMLDVFSLSPMDGSEINTVTIPVRFDATGAQQQVPLYRLYNDRIGDHFYTGSAFERDQAASRFGYQFEGTIGFMYTQQSGDLVPLYRLYNTARGDHFYTTSAFERNAAVQQYGYVAEGITGYLNLQEVGTTTALYRFFNQRIVDHFYTTSPAERQVVMNRGDYRSEGTTGYVEKAPEATLLKVYFGNTVFDPQGLNCGVVYPVTREVAKTTGVARAAIEELLRGPTSTEQALGYGTNLPAMVELNSIRIENGTAFVDFSEELDAVGGSCRVTAIRAQIEQTLKQFPAVQNVVISVNGRTGDVLQP